MSLSLAQLSDALARSGLLPAPELSAFVDGLPAEERPQDGPALAGRLCREGRLTPYQSEVLLKGEVKGLVYGDYTVLEKIGAGGMGQVFKAVHRRMKRIVAIKTLPPATLESEKALKRFYREVEAAAKLAHPNIVAAYDAGEWQGIHYFVMEYVEGRDLAQVLRERGPLPVSEAVGALVQAAAGLEHAHAQGVFHRDIKLANLLVDKAGVVKVLDMGIARVQSLADESGDEGLTDGLTNTNQMLGTVEYVAPEQAKNAKVADHRSDIYSLGCCLYKLVSGKPPFTGDSAFMTLMAHMKDPIPSLRATNADVPPKLEEAFQRMMAKQPAARYQAMSEVIGALLGCGISVRLPAAATAGAMMLRAAESSAMESRSAAESPSNSPTLSRANADQRTPVASDGDRKPGAAKVKELGQKLQQGSVQSAAWAKTKSREAWDFAREWRTRRPHWAAKVDAAHARAAQSVGQSKNWLAAKKSAWLAAHPTWTERHLNLLLASGGALLMLLLAVPLLWSAGSHSVAAADAVDAEPTVVVANTPEVGPVVPGEAWMDQVVSQLSARPVVSPNLGSSITDVNLDPSLSKISERSPLELTGENARLDEPARKTQAALPPHVLAATHLDRSDPEVDIAGRSFDLPWQHQPAPLPEVAGRPVDESLDLLRLIDVRRDAVYGTWLVTGNELSGQMAPVAIGRQPDQRPLSLLLRYTPPPEFDLVITAARRSGTGPLLLSMPVEMQGVGKLPTLVFGAEPPRNRFGNENPVNLPVIKNATPVRIVLKVRPVGLSAEVAGVRVDPSALLDAQLDGAFRHSEDVVFRLGSHASAWKVTEFSMLPVSETAEPVRLPKTNIRALGESQLQPAPPQPQPPPPPRPNSPFRELAPDAGQIPVDPIRKLFPKFGPGKGF